MESRSDLDTRCAAIVAALDVELEWCLSIASRRAYALALPHYLPDDCSELQIRKLALRYHQDHALVKALRDYEHAEHNSAWTVWATQALLTLHHEGLAWSDDTAVGPEDLAQVALAALARALPSFRYSSRFSTWAHQVIVRSVQRYLRDLHALKRSGRPTSIAQVPEVDLPIEEAEHPETVADASMLAVLVGTILGAQPDARLVHIFRLWAQEDMQVEEIGRRVYLSPSQVRVLLNRIRHLLQHDPAIRAWLDDLAENVIGVYSVPK